MRFINILSLSKKKRYPFLQSKWRHTPFPWFDEMQMSLPSEVLLRAGSDSPKRRRSHEPDFPSIKKRRWPPSTLTHDMLGVTQSLQAMVSIMEREDALERERRVERALQRKRTIDEESARSVAYYGGSQSSVPQAIERVQLEPSLTAEGKAVLGQRLREPSTATVYLMIDRDDVRRAWIQLQINRYCSKEGIAPERIKDLYIVENGMYSLL